MTKKTPMTKSDAERIQSGTVKKGGDTSKGSFPARVQSSASKKSIKGVK